MMESTLPGLLCVIVFESKGPGDGAEFGDGDRFAMKLLVIEKYGVFHLPLRINLSKISSGIIMNVEE